MWIAAAHLAGPTLLTAAIAVVGTSIRAAFRYPHMWRYLEFRYGHGHRSTLAPLHGLRSLPCKRLSPTCRARNGGNCRGKDRGRQKAQP
jgi:hypothetical protein